VPTFNHLWATCPHATLTTHGPDVGLPTGQMGNSEVGHTNIGAGRVVAMDLGQIDLAVEDGSFATNPALMDFAAKVKAAGGTAHLMGVVSDGGVHGHINHILAACRAITALGVPVALHAITDGRDVAPSSAQASSPLVKRPALWRAASPPSRAATGRWTATTAGNGSPAPMARWSTPRAKPRPMPLTAVANSYAQGRDGRIHRPHRDRRLPRRADGDGLFCLNFRADRAREILAAIGDPAFHAFDTGTRPQWSALLGMVEYSDRHNAYMAAAFPKRVLVNTLGEWVAATA
jgi:2,3-bisphosphoglycerate-independent phosphoglycerate mutase